MPLREPSHDIGKALVIVIGALFVVPATFAYYVLANALREQSICHIGPLDVQTNAWDNQATFAEKRATLMNLYGSYTTFDDASYYFIKTPYEIAPQVLPDYGYWSVSTLALTLLSPKLRQARQEEWKAREDTFDIVTSPSIQWDQSHEIDLKTAKNSPHSHSSKANRWCLVSHQDPKHFQQKQASFDSDSTTKEEPRKQEEPIFRKDPIPQKYDSHKYKICGPPQASILSSGNQAPYFIELPLQPPLQGRWKKYEGNALMSMTDYDDDDNPFANKRQRRGPTNPFQIKVQCHVHDMELSHLAHGTLQPDSQPHMGWEHASRIEMPVWNVFFVPGTLVVMCTLLMVQLRRRSRPRSPRSSSRRRPRIEHPVEPVEWNLVRALQQLWFFESWSQWGLTMVWVYLIGSCLEPMMGSLPYLSATLVFLQVIALLDEQGSSFLWVCFGQSILLAQLEPSLSVGPIEISSFSLGDSVNALRLNIVSILIALAPFLQLTESPWRSAASCVLVGWCLARPLTMELLGAPQWTIPTLLMGHLWWKLTKLPDHAKKTDVEMVAFCDETDDMSVISEQTDYSSSTAGFVAATAKRLCATLYAAVIYGFFSAWVLLTFGCIFTLDWTLVVGCMITLWLYIGTTQFPRHQLWSLYHMVAATFLIVMITMSIAGWYLCHVAISTHALRALPTNHVYLSTGLQLAAHFSALVHTVCTKHWETSHHVPGFYFWRKIRVIGEELRTWYYVCGGRR